jgi:hypothetical protein
MASGPLFIFGIVSYVLAMNDVLALPTGLVTDASLEMARKLESPSLVEHSIRSFLFARLLADHEGCLIDADYDEDLLFAATVMHDLGLGDHSDGRARFEVEGADLAATLLREHGVNEADVDRVWEAIALHAAAQIADRRGLLTYLTHKGVFIDVGELPNPVADRLHDAVLTAYPKPPGDTSVIDAIVKHAAQSAATAPPGSVGAYLLLATQGERT